MFTTTDAIYRDVLDMVLVGWISEQIIYLTDFHQIFTVWLIFDHRLRA